MSPPAALPLIDPRAQEVLAFWFGEEDQDAAAIEHKSAMWFARDADVDAEIHGRFSTLHRQAVEGDLASWAATPRGCLALIVLVDQFSRNLFRNDGRAFEHDAMARAWTGSLLASGADRELRPIERVFAYLPLEHSEHLPDQATSVELFSTLLSDVADELHATFADFLDFAQRHRDIVARFGRFPHRNAVLGRTSTAAEIAFLETPGSHF